MSRFTKDVTVVNRLTRRVHEWELCEPITYRLQDDERSEVVTVPPGFTTDFASVPRPFWFWIAPWGRHGRAAILHDFLYQLGSVTDPAAGRLRRPSKREADRIFREAMAVLDEVIVARSTFWRRVPTSVLRVRLGLARVRRWLIWAAVAVFGHWAYRQQQAEGGAPPHEDRMLRAVEALLAERASPSAGPEDPHGVAPGDVRR